MNHQRFRSEPRVGFVSNKCCPSVKLGIYACISSRITTVIHVVSDYQRNDNCFNEPFAVSPYKGLYLDMHGLIFETSIWLLAGSTRWMYTEAWVQKYSPANKSTKNFPSQSSVILNRINIDSKQLNSFRILFVGKRTLTSKQLRLWLHLRVQSCVTKFLTKTDKYHFADWNP